MNNCVYAHINNINGKVYIGISQNTQKRWRHNGNGYFRNKHFSDAIKKYGWDNFSHMILIENVSREQASIIEKELIKKYRANDKRYGYNITDGGEHFLHSEESKALMSQRRKGKGPKSFSEDHRRKLSENHGGGAEKKRVRCIETGFEYESILQASKSVGLSKKMISNCCNRVIHYNTAGGYHWEFVG